MPRRVVLLVALLLVISGCGDDDSSRTTAPPSTAAQSTVAPTTEAPTTTAPATTTTTAAPTTTAPPPPPVPFDDDFSFALQSGPNDWESQFIDPGAVVFHDGMWHMFYNGIDRWPTHVKVGYATSPDGLDWTKQTDEPLFTTDIIPYAGISAFMSAAAVMDDGTWVIWFYTVQSGNTFSSGVVGRVTAPDPLGPWTPDPEPTLDRGPQGAWDSTGVSNPTVLRVGEEWWMWFDANRGDLESEGDRSVGLATSADGVTWARYDDPATTEPPFGESDPVMTTDPGGWDERRVYDPEVVAVEDGFAMTYFTRRPGTTFPEYDAGLAFSSDGVTWEKDSANPFFESRAFGYNGVFLSALADLGGSYVLLFDASTGNGTDIFYRVHEGPLAPSG